jgi:hypothetical protein
MRQPCSIKQFKTTFPNAGYDTWYLPSHIGVNIGVGQHILSFCRLGEGLDELLPAAPAQDVINRAGKFNPQATWHAKELPKSPVPVKR